MKISIYIHIPFCVRKCLYCDFLSGPAPSAVRTLYIAALCKEIHLRSLEFDQSKDTVTSIFFGGGTPSSISGKDIQTILSTVKECFTLEKDCEISIEVNPGTEDLENKFRIYKEAGINRMSIGLQSANDEELKILGRIHNTKDFIDTYNAAVSTGFKNLNVDLISGIPGQTVDRFEENLKFLLGLNPPPTHISVYGLIIEEGTEFYRMYGTPEEPSADRDGDAPSEPVADRNVDSANPKPCLPSEEEERLMYRRTKSILEKEGYHRYEISNYALPGFECRHNCVYWKRGNYLGIGLGASGMINNVRYKNISDMDLYLKVIDDERLPYDEDETEHLSKEDMMAEFMFLGLRMTEGVSVKEFEDTFLYRFPKEYEKAVNKYTGMGLLTKKDDRVMLTEDGIDVSNVIMSEFLFD